MKSEDGLVEVIAELVEERLKMKFGDCCQRCRKTHDARRVELFEAYNTRLCLDCMNAWEIDGRGRELLARADAINDERHMVKARSTADGEDRLEQLTALTRAYHDWMREAFDYAREFVTQGRTEARA